MGPAYPYSLLLISLTMVGRDSDKVKKKKKAIEIEECKEARSFSDVTKFGLHFREIGDMEHQVSFRDFTPQGL